MPSSIAPLPFRRARIDRGRACRRTRDAGARASRDLQPRHSTCRIPYPDRRGPDRCARKALRRAARRDSAAASGRRSTWTRRGSFEFEQFDLFAPRADNRQGGGSPGDASDCDHEGERASISFKVRRHVARVALTGDPRSARCRSGARATRRAPAGSSADRVREARDVRHAAARRHSAVPSSTRNSGRSRLAPACGMGARVPLYGRCARPFGARALARAADRAHAGEALPRSPRGSSAPDAYGETGNALSAARVRRPPRVRRSVPPPVIPRSRRPADSAAPRPPRRGCGPRRSCAEKRRCPGSRPPQASDGFRS